MRNRFRRASLAFVVGAAVVTGVGVAPAAAAPAPASAAIGTVSAMVVDPAHGHVFVGGDRGVAVFDEGTSRVVKVFPRPASALALRANVLYVGRTSGVDRIDTATLQPRASVVTNTGPVRSLAFAGGRLWFIAQDLGGAQDVLASVDIATGTLGPVVKAGLFGRLLAAPGRSNLLWLLGLDDPFDTVTPSLTRYVVQGGAATATASVATSIANVAAATVAVDGSSLAISAVPSGSNQPRVFEYNATTLTPTGVSVLAGNDGAVALSSFRLFDQNQFVAALTKPRGAAPVQQFAYGASMPDHYYVFNGNVVDLAATDAVVVGAVTTTAGLTKVQLFSTTS